jgi:hypothetical protein
MLIENWPIGIVSFTLEAGDFVRAQSSDAFDQAEISSELRDLIGKADSWSNFALKSNEESEPQVGGFTTLRPKPI